MNKRVIILVLLMIVFVLIISTAITAAQPAGPASESVANSGHKWFYSEIDVPGFYFGMGDRSLRVSESGVPHLVYGASHLYLARYQSGAWTSEVVDSGVSVGEGASMALDANGRPHIAYKDTLNGKLKYAHWTGVSWQIYYLDDVSVWNFSSTAIELDPAGRPHILYGIDEPGKRGLHHAFWDGAHWQFESIFGDSIVSPSITIGETGQLHISFIDLYDRAMYGRRDAGGWHLEEVGPVDYNAGTSLALDSAGQPHIAYLFTDWDDDISLMYATRPAGVWTTTEIRRDSGSYNFSVSLVLDDADRPHIADGKAHHFFDGSAWQEEPIPGLTGSWFESIALDQAGRPMISALSYGGPVECAHYDGQTWIVDELAHSLTMSGANVLAVASDHTLVTSYLKDGLIYAFRDDGAWHTSVITTDTDYLPNDLIVDANDRPHLCLRRNGPLSHAYQEGSEWKFEQIDDRVDYPGQCTLAIDGDGQLHAVYLNGQAYYAKRTGETWQTEAVGGTDETVSMALDSAGRPHLVYLDRQYGEPDYKYTLQHAVLIDGDWITDTIDTGAPMYGTAIAIDESDIPHVAYHYRDDLPSMRYARLLSSEWYTETIDSDLPASGVDVRLALDEQGRPHLSIYLTNYLYLFHAFLNDHGWQLDPVAPYRVYGNDMVVDGKSVNFSFFYESNRGLVLATNWPAGLDELNYLPLIARQ